ncbi:adropin isoform X2 [Anolis carolinensis]|uniref:Adropin n=1 Tax=Anolis carolinensis TaxID=28377 RepID=A0A803TEH7_ANOCA|nr:PREDICTED: adropin [Anolis carolinensis]|eukprot:XP_016852883.1 PREDICTED: adropin [Anolis carolinensis]
MGSGLSTGAVVAIVFNCVIAFLLLLLFLILCKACRTPASCPDKSPSSEADERGNEERYLLQP